MNYAALVLASACTAVFAAETPVFFRDVLPILEKHCFNCHQAGGIATMQFSSYELARPWAKAIRDATIRKKMPPWFRESGTLEFSNDASLKPEELATIVGWADGGAPPGDVIHSPKPQAAVAEATGDLVLEMPKAFAVEPDATIPYQFIVLPTGIAEDRWIQQVDIRPGAREVVHHIVAYVRETDDAWLSKAPRRVMHIPPPEDRQTKADILGVYTPGARSIRFPDGMAKKLPAGSEVVLQFHYTPSKTRAADRTRVILHFSKAAPEKRILTLQMGQDKLAIPPYESKYRASVTGTLPNDALLLSLMPHMHLRGAAFDFEIAGDRGRVETLLRVRPFDFHWQLTYWLRTPRLLPKGTRLRFTGYFDNSANNPRNPNPAMAVGWGEQSWDEMMIGFFDVAVDADVDKRTFFVR